jgi:hypothetical protein
MVACCAASFVAVDELQVREREHGVADLAEAPAV